MCIFCGEPRSLRPMKKDTGDPLVTADGVGQGTEEHH